MNQSSWILSNLTTTVIVLDHQLRIIDLNTAAESLFSISRRKAIRQAWHYLFRNQNKSFQQLLHAILHRSYPIIQYGLKLNLIDGTIIVDCTISPVEEQKILIEIRRVDDQLRRNKEKEWLHQNSATRELLRGLAHEIKNPLGGLRGAAQLLSMELKNKELLEYAQVIIAEADRLTTLVDRMLGSRRKLDKKLLNIHHVLERVCALIQSDPESQNLIERDYDPSIPELYGDEDQLLQAFLNIVKNAVQATQGQGIIQLKTRVLRQFTLFEQRYRLVVQVQIIDQGPGIPEELKPRIFYPMVTGRKEGSGLGLSIAQSIVNDHQGMIEFDSQVGQTVFTIYLPLIDHE